MPKLDIVYCSSLPPKKRNIADKEDTTTPKETKKRKK
tara:strand:+ start:2177 stop:2287 length:111 start_codon:yes stop_codon:yes gene_type:complete